MLRGLRWFGPSQGGAAAVEFALWLGVSLYPLLNAVDFGLYAFERTQVENSAQMAVQAISTKCGQVTLPPVLSNCSNASNIMTARAQSTSLGSQVNLSGTYECDTGTVSVGSISASQCPSSSGYYIAAAVTYTYTPLFNAPTITSLLGTTITRTYWARVL